MMIAGGRWWMCGVAIAVTAGLLGCSTEMPADSTPPVETPDPGGTYGPGADTIPPTGLLAQRASRSSTIALSDDNKLVAMVNPDDDSISVFKTADHLKVASVKTGDEPWSIVFYPDNKTAFVANRAAGTVVKVSGLDTLDPKVEGAPVDVGSEPTGLALSPSGAKLFVAELAQGRIEVLRTDTMQIIGHIDAPKNPRSIL